MASHHQPPKRDTRQAREELEDEIADVLTDSLDMDWTGRIGARAILRWAEEKGALEALLAALNGRD
jgi:hypothetical protein